MPEIINPPVITPQPPIISQDDSMPAISPTVEIDQTNTLPLNECNSNTSTQILNNTNSQASAFKSTDQQISYSSHSSYFPPQITTFQNSSIPAFQVINSQYSSQNPGSTPETIKPFVLMPEVTTIPSFTLQESTNALISQDPCILPAVPSTSLPQSGTTQELTHQSSTVFQSQNNYSQYHPTDVGSTTTITDVQSSKEISNYFTQFQTQANSSNNSSSIPMFSVKNFPQISPLAQPLGKS